MIIDIFVNLQNPVHERNHLQINYQSGIIWLCL